MPVQIPNDISLSQGEEPVWFGHPTWAAFSIPILLALILCITVIFIPISLIILFAIWVNVTKTEYFISNKRIYAKAGLISRISNDIKIDWVTNLTVSQGFLGRILNFGNVGITSPGERAGAIRFQYVADPWTVKKTLEKCIEDNKKRVNH